MRRPLVAMLLLAACATARDNVEIELAHDSPAERAKAAQLRKLIDAYDLSKWTFSRTVVIDHTVEIPHSHPVVTLDAPEKIYPDDDVLAVYVHEQSHWHEEAKVEERNRVLAELKKLYPDAPKGPPEGARNQESTYRHLIVCHLEFEAMKQLVGEQRARAAMKKPYYRWVYRTILADNEKIKEIVQRNGLSL